MTFDKRLMSFVLILLLIGCSGQQPRTVSGEYTVKSDASNISFAITKNQTLTVPGMFASVNGSVSIPESGELDDGSGSITVDLGSLNTGIDIRDQRTLKHFFGVGDTAPKSQSTAQFNLRKVVVEEGKQKLDSPDAQSIISAIGTLRLNQTSQPTTVRVRVHPAGPNRLKLTTQQPFVLDADEFDLIAGLEDLMELCNEELAPTVPVNLDLVLVKTNSRS